MAIFKVGARMSSVFQLSSDQATLGDPLGDPLFDLLSYRRSSYSSRSVSKGDLVKPSSKMGTYGDRSFAVCDPRLWNSLPLSIRRSSSVDIFKNV